MHSRNVEIKSPCHESWDAMHGDDARRFCDVCAKHVHNLSAMTRQAATDLLEANKGQHLCVRYSNQEDGQIAFRDTPVVPVSRLRTARTAFAAMMLAACTPHGDGPPIQDLGDIAIETMARDAKPSPEGGCEVQTGPFTTMHFPRGHEVCRNVADLGEQIKPPTPPIVEPPPPPPTLMGAPEPVRPPPPPVTEELMGKVAPPVEHVKMGEAMPEVKEPCDPQPGFAPPPPSLLMGQTAAPVVAPPPPSALMGGAVPIEAEPPSPPPALMGDIAVAPEPPPPPVEPPRVKMGKIASPKTGGAVIDEF
ncbi:hypothetical protein [Nannocystis pusilla]|uniref:Uncharacterized protein n=1 Tax=Nannocystis pusilla TaxID=889268 RepID=A0ABS7TL56_9BACT|nr:hypothetical protein [Nannocystis pusilla]MBZ5708960.1 hypothetical protein [Nannocystis pusilla]